MGKMLFPLRPLVSSLPLLLSPQPTLLLGKGPLAGLLGELINYPADLVEKSLVFKTIFFLHRMHSLLPCNTVQLLRQYVLCHEIWCLGVSNKLNSWWISLSRSGDCISCPALLTSEMVHGNLKSRFSRTGQHTNKLYKWKQTHLQLPSRWC